MFVFIAPSIDKRWTRRRSVLRLHPKLLWPACAYSMGHVMLFECVRRNFVSVRGWSDYSEAASLSVVDLSSGVCVYVFVSFGSSSMLSLRGPVSFLFVGRHKNASVVLSLIPARCTNSNSNLFSSSRRRHRVSRSEKSANLRIQFNTPWSGKIINRWPFKYGRRWRTAHTIARHLCWVLSYCFSISARKQNQYPIDIDVSYGCFCSEKEQIETLRASVPSVTGPSE